MPMIRFLAVLAGPSIAVAQAVTPALPTEAARAAPTLVYDEEAIAADERFGNTANLNEPRPLRPLLRAVNPPRVSSPPPARPVDPPRPAAVDHSRMAGGEVDRHQQWMRENAPRAQDDSRPDASIVREHLAAMRTPSREWLDAAEAAVRGPGAPPVRPAPPPADVFFVGSTDGMGLVTGLRSTVVSTVRAQNTALGADGAWLEARADGADTAIAKLCGAQSVVAFVDRPMTAGERVRCASASVPVLEVLAGSQPFAIVASTRNRWLTQLSGEQLKALLDPTRAARPLWSEFGQGFPRSAVSVYSPPPTDSSTLILQSVLQMGALTGLATYAGDAAGVKAAVARDLNGIGWVAAHEAAGPGVRSVPLVESGGRSLLANLTKPVFVYVNVGRDVPPLYRQVAQAVVAALPTAGGALGSTAIGDPTRAASASRLASGQGGYLTSPGATASEVLRSPPRAYLN